MTDWDTNVAVRLGLLPALRYINYTVRREWAQSPTPFGVLIMVIWVALMIAIALTNLHA